MKITNIEYQEYELPLNSPVKTSRETLHSRSGYLVKVYTGDGSYGVGDIAPIPAFGAEDFESVLGKLEEIKANHSKLSAIEATPRSIYNGLKFLSDFPATRAGFEQACIALASKIQGKTIPEFLMFDCGKTISVNGLISMMSPADTQIKAQELLVQGYQAIKLKIGRTDFEEDICCIEAVRKESDTVALRLDANGNWNIEQALDYVKELEPYPIQYVEEPVTVNDLHLLAQLRRESPVKIALDESAQSFDDVVRIIHSNAADVVIVKPVVCGGILSSIRIMHTALEYTMEVIVTSAFESTIGRSAAVLLASTRSTSIHGLDTARYFVNDVTDDPFPVKNGVIKIDDPAQFSFDI